MLRVDRPLVFGNLQRIHPDVVEFYFPSQPHRTSINESTPAGICYLAVVEVIAPVGTPPDHQDHHAARGLGPRIPSPTAIRHQLIACAHLVIIIDVAGNNISGETVTGG